MCQFCGQPDNVRCNCQVTQPFCDQCGNDNACEDKIDAQCVFYHLNCTDPAGLPNLGINCDTDLETILEALDDLVGNSLNITFEGQETNSIRWVSNGPAGHKPYAHVKLSDDVGQATEERADGLYTPATVFVDETNDCIEIAVTQDESGAFHITPSLDILCLLNRIRDEFPSEFCDLVAECEEEAPTVLFTCGAVSVDGTFVLGTPSSGTVTIPVTVTGTGTITVFITSAGGEFTGSITQVVNPLTTSIIVPLDYTGGGTNGTIPLTMNFFDTANVIAPCNIDVIVDAGVGCTDVTIDDAPLPDAQQDSAYNFSLSLNGTAPFVLANVVKPSWMTISIVAGNVVFGGTPTSGDLGTGITVSFDVTNCTTGTDSFSDTIDVTECFTCGDSISIETANLNYVDLGFFPLCVDGVNEVTLNFEVFERPNRFSIRENGTTIIASSGWRGVASYPGPWGASLSTATTGSFSFNPIPGNTYEIRIEAGNADPGNPLSDNFSVTINCTGDMMRFGNDDETICGEAEQEVFYTGVLTPTVTILYSDVEQTLPFTGFDFVGRTSSAVIYNLNSVTGLLGAPTGNSC